ncbi:dipeptide/oligopeptide/nickel ABC transporter permease/ATP-binding protein [Streptomyces sp. SDT5-1]|uniref:dipeptide/oligopeptide/nickel ABC transporter permease/ATP-binding protein n=1 Tax=Streptomyces sp. SDT5-1 TaxID=3406418 RepID=UPI003FD49952
MTDVSAPDLSSDSTPRRQAGFWARLARRPSALASAAVLGVIVLACLLAPVLAPADPLSQDLSQVLRTPGSAHLLGTDSLGRDVLSRLLYGGRSSLAATLVALGVAAALGPSLGIWAGYRGGRADRVISAGIVTLLAVPSIVILLAVLAEFPSTMAAPMIALGVLGAAPIALVVRGATRSISLDAFVSAAELAGVSQTRIMVRHILPRLTGVLVVQLSLFACVALVMQGGLAYLGLGIPQPAPSWGGGIAEAQKAIFRTQWLFVPYGGVLALTTLAVALLGDAVRDAAAETLHAESPGTRRDNAGARPAPDPAPPQSAPDKDDTDLGPDTVLRVRELSVTFEGQPRPAVAGAGLAVRRGEVLGVVGESGSGKSTLMMALLGLLPGSARVTGGPAELDGRDLLALDRRSMRRTLGKEIALIAQDPMAALDPAFTVGSLLDEIVRGHGAPAGRTVRERTDELLRRVSFKDPERIRRLYPHELSGGMAQRVCIAMAISAGPKVLVADEATTALDVTVQTHILDLLRDLADTASMAVVVLTHNLGVVADICDRVVVMRNGQVVESGDTDQVFYESTEPYVAELLASTPSLIPLDRDSAGPPSPRSTQSAPSEGVTS